MSSSDAPPTSRREMRAQAQERARTESAPIPAVPAAAEPIPAETVPAAPVPAARAVPAEPSSAERAVPARPVALAWVDDDAVGLRRAPGDLTAATSPYVPVLPDLLPARRRRSVVPALVVLAIVLALVGGYTAATQLWTLDNVAPAAAPDEAPTVRAPDTEISWPAEGLGAVGIGGVTTVEASSGDVDAMASITKLVSVLMVQDQDPIAEGEEGPAREIAYADRVDYWGFLGRGESAIDVPVGETLTRYQLMQGALIASAGNYADMLVREFWPTDEEFAAAAREWLDAHGLKGITVVEPTGIDRENTADAASLVRLGEVALADPVVAEIVATRTAELPGAGEIDNTNPLLSDDTVVGIKTGGLFGHYNLLAARDVAAGDTTVRVYAAVVGQPTEQLRADETAALLDQIAAEASVRQTIPAGTRVGSVTTAWGTTAGIVTAADASVLLWDGAGATGSAELELGDARAAGDVVGTMTLAGPLDSASTDVTLTAALGEPDAWWRFTHPLELFGLAGSSS
ncbi:D-alanyl-D-alanine carboxypeptidase family protein [Microbacterium sp. PA5]|uniref:D-alanyl-D-alanine carboxypeptidase family protein n=1 Tax=Microbacterium sp. PA5 TaxID=3416654 RepID=UPI003CEE6D0E